MYGHCMSRMTSTTVYLTEEQLEGLRAASRRRQRPMAMLLREAVDALLSGEVAQLTGLERPARAKLPEEDSRVSNG